MRLLRWLEIVSLGVVLWLSASGEAQAMRFLSTSEVPSALSWGPTSRGLRISLTLDHTNLRIGDEVHVTIYLENLGPDRNIKMSCDEWSWYELRIADAGGRAIERTPDTTVDCYANPSHWPLKHGAVIESSLRLVDKYRIAEAGSYTITAASTIHLPATYTVDSSGKQTFNNPILTSLLSNDVGITVGPRVPASATNSSSQGRLTIWIQPNDIRAMIYRWKRSARDSQSLRPR